MLLGTLCKEHGYTYEWPSGREPLCRTENLVPQVVPGLSSSCTTASFSRSPPQDLSVSFDPANARSDEGLRETAAKELRETATGKVFPNGSRTSQRISRSQKHLHPQKFLMTQIRNVLNKWHHGSTVFLLTSQKIKIAKHACEPK